MAEAADHEPTPDDDDDVEMTSDMVIKEETSIEAIPAAPIDPDDDDVVLLPSEEPVVTEILDETEQKVSDGDMNITDDDVMIQEPKIETQLVPDDDDDDQQHSSTTQNTAMPFIVKIKEEPKDDGYEDLVNEEDAFVEVTAIANDDMMHGKI